MKWCSFFIAWGIVFGLVRHGNCARASTTSRTIGPVRIFFNRITDTTFGVVREGINVLNATVSNIMTRVGGVSERIRALIEEFRQRMMMGIPELGVPILEPLTINKIILNISHHVNSLQGYVENIEVTQLSKFRIDHVAYSLQNILTLNLTFPQNDIKGYYDVKGHFGKRYNVYGHGPFWLKLYMLSVGTVSQIKFDNGYYVDWIRISVKLKKLENRFENLMRDPDVGNLFNKVISRLGPEALDILWPNFEKGVSKLVKKIINNKLKDFELGSILGRLVNVFRLNLNQGRISIHS